ncbi:hypothetical protein J2W57_000523 [Chryseobacterium ginsenosidimutans]|uniref:Uncharacterized protein n=1 Tax=Chryseobacterium geocarposphaerae TaxID=1416776 RepID=A0ABU1LAN0_9FLAO|nr:hypothetical protein [Chryseobacterium geocarposphaerae]MDR6697174.1 hypothetical protein [Chryseobacterium ginsenosidimutans]
MIKIGNGPYIGYVVDASKDLADREIKINCP